MSESKRGKKKPSAKQPQQNVSDTMTDPGDTLEEELAWCIEQLQLGMSKPEAKPDSRQVKEASKVLKILQNPKAPLVKKRQAMRLTFGDYRKKMKEEENKYLASSKKMSLSTVSHKKQQQATFFKRAHPYNPETSSCSSVLPATVGKGLDFGQADQPFTFDFAISQSLDQSEANSLPAVNCSCPAQQKEIMTEAETAAAGPETELEAQNQGATSEPDCPVGQSSKTAVNYYKMVPSGTERGFQFGFDVTDTGGT